LEQWTVIFCHQSRPSEGEDALQHTYTHVLPANVQICGYIEEEEAHLKEDLLAHPLGIYNEASATIGSCYVVHRCQIASCSLNLVTAALSVMSASNLCAEAKGVVINRLQNVVITLDKVKMVLAHNQVQAVC
jgi:hypothetical protein